MTERRELQRALAHEVALEVIDAGEPQEVYERMVAQAEEDLNTAADNASSWLNDHLDDIREEVQRESEDPHDEEMSAIGHTRFEVETGR